MRELGSLLDGKTHIIWDWNGTLLDDVDLCVEVVGSILDENALPRVDLESYRRVFRFPVSAYYADLGFDVSDSRFDVLSATYMQRFSARVNECALFEGAQELLAELRERGVKSSVLSASEERALHAQLVHHGILGDFDHAFGLSDIHARGKLGRARELMAVINVDAQRVVLVGDTDHDLEVGKALGIEVILLGGGHQCAQRLAEAHVGGHVLDRTRVARVGATTSAVAVAIDAFTERRSTATWSESPFPRR